MRVTVRWGGARPRERCIETASRPRWALCPCRTLLCAAPPTLKALTRRELAPAACWLRPPSEEEAWACCCSAASLAPRACCRSRSCLTSAICRWRRRPAGSSPREPRGASRITSKNSLPGEEFPSHRWLEPSSSPLLSLSSSSEGSSCRAGRRGQEERGGDGKGDGCWVSETRQDVYGALVAVTRALSHASVTLFILSKY